MDDSVSETIVYKKIDVQSKIEKMETLLSFVEEKKSKLLDLSKDWKKYLEDKEKVPTQKFTQLDLEKLSLLREHFVVNLKPMDIRVWQIWMKLVFLRKHIYQSLKSLT